VIHEFFQEIRRPIWLRWIKSHQDETNQYSQLSPDAKHNVDADQLATSHHLRKRQAPTTRTTENIPAPKVSISINKTRYYANIDANLRFHSNGGYIRIISKAHTDGTTPSGRSSTFRHLVTVSNNYRQHIILCI
jgi:hypothetical protein